MHACACGIHWRASIQVAKAVLWHDVTDWRRAGKAYTDEAWARFQSRRGLSAASRLPLRSRQTRRGNAREEGKPGVQKGSAGES